MFHGSQNALTSIKVRTWYERDSRFAKNTFFKLFDQFKTFISKSNKEFADFIHEYLNKSENIELKQNISSLLLQSKHRYYI